MVLIKEILTEINATQEIIKNSKYPDGAIIKAVHNRHPITRETLSFDLAYIDFNLPGDKNHRVFGYDTAHQKKDSLKVEAHCHYQGKDAPMVDYDSFEELLDRFVSGVEQIRQGMRPSIMEYKKTKTLKDFDNDEILYDFYLSVLPVIRNADEEREEKLHNSQTDSTEIDKND